MSLPLRTAGLAAPFFILSLSGCLLSHDRKDPPAKSPAQAMAGEPRIGWRNPSLPIRGTVKAMQFLTSSSGYLLADSTDILFTRDGGATLERQVKAPSGLNAIRFIDAQRGIAVGKDGLIMKTSDAGAHWKTLHAGNSSLQGLCVDPSGKAAAVGAEGALLVSRDAGSTWSLRQSNPEDDLIACVFIDSATLFVTGQDLGLRSRDGGETWTRHRLPASLASLWAGDDSLMLGVGGDPYRSENAGIEWRSWYPGQFSDPTYRYLQGHMRALAVAPDSSVYLAGGAGAIMRGSLRNPETDLSVTFVDTTVLRTIVFPSVDTGYAGGEFGAFVRTLDAGKTWKPCSQVLTRFNMAAIAFADSATGYAVGQAGAFLRTQDGGTTWQPVKGAPAEDLWAVHFADKRIGAVAGNHGTLLWTRDGGASWTLGWTGKDLNWTAVWVQDSLHAYLGRPNMVFATQDGGETWDSLPEARHGAGGWDLGDGLFFDEWSFTKGLARLETGSERLALLYRDKAGDAWTRIDFTGLNGGFAAFARADATTLYAVGGSMLYRVDSRERTLAFKDLGPGLGLLGIACTGPHTCFVTGANGVILEVDPP